ncbi:lysylphosphatidylglycerol synthase transmembrane domain-containing protein [Streptomyces sp. NPDC005423]|uniref:lysylphosphatidylglycerol synthase transmembrane domain-containing protein n=1 Tax=Streptomyces sp. NPDC005423 TaxID=3155343 RepID=UPI0033A3A1C9
MSLLPLDDVPAPASPRSPLRSPGAARLVTRVLTLLPLLLVAVWTAVDRRAVWDGAARLATADPRWLLSAALCTALGWVAAACVRQGALPERLPFGPLLASQFAAGAANHALPAGLGAHAVTLRFLQSRGIPPARATASLALYSLVKPLAKTLVLVVTVLACPDLPPLGRLLPDGWTLLLAVAGSATALATAALLLTFVRSLRRPASDLVRTALIDARLLHTRPARVLALWGGAAAMPVLQATVIASVGAALGLPLSWAQVVLAFLAAGTVAGAVPAPGGIGPVDAALVVTLVGFGAPMDISTATVIGYRVIAVWVPLLPGALVLSALAHRGVL